MRKTLLILLGLQLSIGFAHKPFFPDGSSPFELQEAPTISQAYYVALESNETHTFLLPPLPEAVPIEVLVLDDELGRGLELSTVLICNNLRTKLPEVDIPFYEEFSKRHHRYRVRERLGPTEEPCELRVHERNGAAAPYTFAIGAVENFGFADVMGFFSLGAKLKAWESAGSPQSP